MIHYFTVQSNMDLKNEKTILEEKESSQSRDMKGTKILDHINFDILILRTKVLDYTE